MRWFYVNLGHIYLFILCKSLSKSKASSQKLIGNLRKRLDVTRYCSIFFHSIFYSCQAILHNKIIVNGKFINNCNFMLRKGDFVGFCPKQIYKLLVYHDINIFDLFVCVWSVDVYHIDLSIICISNLPQLRFKLIILI